MQVARKYRLAKVLAFELQGIVAGRVTL